MDRTRFRLAVMLIVGMALVWYAWLIAPARQWVDGKAYWLLFDDPMISMRYARNLAEGHGLVWNPGGPRVEGFSNPLYTLLMAATHLLVPAPNLASLPIILIGAALLVGNGLAAMALSRKAGADDLAALIVLAAVMFQGPLAFWALRGFEVGLVSLLVVVGLWLIFEPRRHALLGPVLALLVVTRADGVVMAGGLLAILGWTACVTRTVRPLLIAAAWAFAASLVQAGLRWSYYGDLLPNTYYLKMTGGPPGPRLSKGLIILERGLIRHHPLVLVLFVGALAQAWACVRERVVLLSCTGLWGLGAAYSILAGGDAWDSLHFPNRFMATVMTLPLIGAGMAASRLVGSRTTAVPVFIVAVAAAFIAGAHVDFLPATRRRMAFMDMGTSLYLRWIADGAIVGGAVLCVALMPPLRRFAMPCAAACAVLLLCTTSGANVIVKRVAGRTAYIEDEVQQVTLARVLERHSRPGARIAVSWAGTMPYHLERTYSDTLGKCDAHIARLPNHAYNPYHAGHMKWDLAYTVATDHPDAILRPYEVTSAEARFLDDSGYLLRSEAFWILSSSTELSEEFKALDDYGDENLRALLKTPPTFPQRGETATPP